MFKNNLSEQQLQLWQQVAGLFRGESAPGVECAGVPGQYDVGPEPGKPVMPEEESGVADASAVAEASGEPGEPGPETAAGGPFTASSPASSGAREETIRMIGEAIDVQTDFPGFDEVEKPTYLSEDLHHLLKKEDTEESLETMAEEGFTPPWAAPGQEGGGAGMAMPLPDDLSREDRDGQAPPPQESQDLGQLNHPLRQEQAPEQSDVPPAEASAEAGRAEPGLGDPDPEPELEPEFDPDPEPERESAGEPGGEEPSPRAFPRAARETGAGGQSGLPDIMQRATMQALRTAREAASRQSAGPEDISGEEPGAGAGLDPAAPRDPAADPREQPASEDFLNDPVETPGEDAKQAESPGQVEGDQPEGSEQAGGEDGSRDDPPGNSPFQSAPWGS